MRPNKKKNEFDEGISKFSGDFLRAIPSEGNSISSPLSCAIALGMVYAGADGETAKIMAKKLCLSEDKEMALQGFENLIQKLNNAEKVEMAITNKIFVKEEFPILAEYVGKLENSFSASAQNVDFNAADATADIINKWVAAQTKNKITDIVNSGEFSSLTRLVLINAIYFKGAWLYPFHKANTTPRGFYTTDTKEIKATFMYQEKYLSYAALEELDAQLLELPYKGEDFSLHIILPNKRMGLAELECKLAGKELTDILDRAEEGERVKVYLPKFKIEKTLELTRALKKMSLGNIFANEANFSGITNIIGEEVKVDSVVQKAFIEVDEEGTVAAAATKVRMGYGSARKRTPPPCIIFDCDHPFFYALTFQKKYLVFGGRLSSPSPTNE